jgi:predicted ATPase/class 3 adenylate cyclase
MHELPTGTVTFLFTDIAGSTRLWEEQPEAMRAAVARHDDLLADAIAAHGGTVFKTVGDSFCAAFERATDALAAALTAQRLLQAEPWPQATPLQVRAALYTGEAEARGGDYFGPPLNRCARILAAGHGGQVLLSQSAAELVRDLLPAGAELKALGEHRLRDLSAPEGLFQLAHPDLASDFPRLRSLQAFAHNLPVQLTSFVGREGELAEVRSLLDGVRLLTLTGAGGTGKTRLALQVAGDLVDGFADGVWFVPLAALPDPSLIAENVLSALGLREEPGRPPVDTLTESLAPNRTLVILDNCEHLVDACAHLAEGLLRACPDLRLLATSREPLQCEGEVLWRVPSLAVPDAGSRRKWRVEELVQHEAVRLFVDRATAANPRFAVNADNARDIAEVCWRLDGIPLALELAAARVRTHTVREIAARLDDRFALLTGGRRTALPRHRTLWAAVDWSYQLLTKAERRLFERLSVFAGSFDLAGAKAVGVGQNVSRREVRTLMTELVSKSLVAREGEQGHARHRLLESLRAYGGERLEERGEVAEIRGRHLQYVGALVERSRTELYGPSQLEWLTRLETEHDNLRGALGWGVQHDVRSAAPLAASLVRFWDARCHWTEGREWLAQCLKGAGDALAALQADLLAGAALLAFRQGDHDEADSLAEAGLRLSRDAAHPQGAAGALNTLGMIAQRRGDYATARAHHETGLALRREAGDEAGAARTLVNLGLLADEQGDIATARRHFEDGLALSRKLGDRSAIAVAINNLANVVAREGDRVRAARLYQESLAAHREVGDARAVAAVLSNLGLLAQDEGDLARIIHDRLAEAR